MAAPKPPKPTARSAKPADAKGTPPTSPKAAPRLTGTRDLSRSLLLTLGLFLVLAAFFNIPFYKTWLREKSPERQGRVARYWAEMRTQKSSDPLEQRMEMRYGVNYNVGKYLRENLKPTDTLLIPPQAYLLETLYSEQNPTVHSWVHPSYIYYHAGRIPTVWIRDSSDLRSARTATHTFYIDARGNLGLIEIRDPATKADILRRFRSYPYMLCYQHSDVMRQVKEGKLRLRNPITEP